MLITCKEAAKLLGVKNQRFYVAMDPIGGLAVAWAFIAINNGGVKIAIRAYKVALF